MESQVARSQGHHDYEQESNTTSLHSGGHGHGGHHDMNPTTIMSKVKEKARKVKDRIKKHSHIHGHEHDHDHDGEYHHTQGDHDTTEEEEDEETVEDPEINGAPIYDSEKASGIAPGMMETTGHPDANVERPTGSSLGGQERHREMHSGGTTAGIQGNSAFDQTRSTNPTENHGRESEIGSGQSKVNLDRPVHLEEDSAVPNVRSAGSVASNYQSKVTDPTAKGGEEIGVTPIVQSMGKMSVHDTEPTRKQIDPPDTRDRVSNISSIAPTGSHDQFSPELSRPRPQDKESVPETSDAAKLSGQPHDSATDSRPSNLSSYAPAPEIPQPDPETYDASKPRDQEKQSSYTDKISSATAAVTNRAASAKNIAASKLGYGGEKEQGGMQGGTGEAASIGSTAHSEDDKSTGRPTDQSSSYTGKITSAAAAIPAGIAGTAISAKNAVTSKLGYGKREDHAGEHKVHEEKQRPISDSGTEHQTEERAKEQGGSSTYTGKISSAAAAIPAAVAGTAISAKNVVASKLGYGAKEDDKYSTHKEESSTACGSTTKQNTEEAPKEQDKGVSMKGYFSKKLKPGDEDKALSELISEVLHIQKKEPKKEEHKEKPIGKVTESKEVAERLGTDEDKYAEKVQESFVNAPGSNVVDKVKGAVTSWFGRGDSQSPQQSADSSQGQESGDDSNIGGERRLQESGN